MIIDDDPDCLFLCQRVLGRLAVTLEEFSDSEAALAAVRSEKPNLIIVDRNMPRLSGDEVAEAVKNDPALSATRVMAVSGSVDPAVEGLRESGPYSAQLSKPYDVHELRNIVTALLGLET
jgi:CheY-like chemotaxis protein